MAPSCDGKLLENITKRRKVQADLVNYFSGFYLTLFMPYKLTSLHPVNSALHTL